MSAKSKIKLGTILKRSSCIRSISESVLSEETQRLYDSLTKRIEEGKVDTNDLLRSYIDSLCNTESASRYYDQPLRLVEKFNDINPAISDRIIYEYTTRVLPYVKEVSYLIDEAKDFNITEPQYDSIKEAGEILIAADRILNNHERISSRFNIENETNRIRTLGLKYVVDSCADMVDTYNIKPYQKMNITLEELVYVLDKKGYDYNKADLVKYTLEHFLLQNTFTSKKEMDYYKRAIKESLLLEDNDLVKVDYIINSNSANVDDISSIQKFINSYLMTTDKIRFNLRNNINLMLAGTSKQDIIANIDKLIYLFWDIYRASDKEDNIEPAEFCKDISDYVIQNTRYIDDRDSIDQFSREELADIIQVFTNVRDSIQNTANVNMSCSLYASRFISQLNSAISAMDGVHSFMYDKENIDNISRVNSDDTELAMNEYKIFKFHNLVRAAFNLDKFLKVKEKKIIASTKNKFKNFVSKANNVLFGESVDTDNIYPYIGSDNRAEITVRVYNYNESDIDNLSDYLQDICNEFNDILDTQNMDSIRSYYIINPGIAEIRIKESSKIILTDEEKQLVESAIDPMDAFYYAEAIDMNKALYENMEDMYNIMQESIEDKLSDLSIYENFNKELFDLTLESLKYLNVDEETIRVFGSKFNDYQFNKAIEENTITESYSALANQEFAVEKAITNWKSVDPELVDISEALEALNILESILNEATPIHKPKVGGAAVKKPKNSRGWADDWDDDDEDDEDDEEPETTKEPPKKEEEKKDTDKEDTSEKDFTLDDLNKDKPTPPKKGLLNLNSIKLGLKGLATVIKDKDTKAKEMAKNLDNAVRAYAKAYKDSLSNERREAIIKGSVIPSFSRCIKAGIGLAAIGVATGNIIIPVIVGLAGLAANKKATDKERILLLDEIENELDVVEKELSYAEENRDMKKYRILLRYKKELQRQYQRIRYNIRIGKDTTISADAGMRADKDEY